MNAASLILAAHLANTESRSALPDAPVVPERERRTRESVHSARLVTARVLRRAADRVEPASQPCS